MVDWYRDRRKRVLKGTDSLKHQLYGSMLKLDLPDAQREVVTAITNNICDKEQTDKVIKSILV